MDEAGGCSRSWSRTSGRRNERVSNSIRCADQGKFLSCLKLHVAERTRNLAQERRSQTSWGQAAKVNRDRRPIAPKQGAILSGQDLEHKTFRF